MDITDIKAVYRGVQSGAVDTRKYFVIVEFEGNRNEDSDSDKASSFESNSDDDQNTIMAARLRRSANQFMEEQESEEAK